MFNLFFADATGLWGLDLWYALPAVIVVSLVYAATRHERMRPILVHATRVAVWIIGFMVLVFAVLGGIDWLTRT